MRISRTAGFVVSSVVCGALVFGSAGGAIAAPVPASPAAEVSAAEDPLPDAAKLTSQVKLLRNIDSVLTPVTDLLDAVIASGGKLSPEELAKHMKAIEDALKDLPKAPGTALEVPAGPAPALPPVVTPRADAGQDLKVKAVADLRAKVGVLVKAAETGDATKVKEAVAATITATLNVIVSIVVGGGLPAPNLAGLPPLPKVPGADVPKAPGAAELPKAPGSAV
ncbi:hypothetical protein J7E96_29980 [Streptomyces sp. ISL-96]|uniref:hypothetical protein n=1 Tax=Streptomyces sp. ISL-96 TaxID=2819191 RepID=UPI001BE5F6D0|nr:hypothetical protein [Streptomyces sp. ISL-96]MBT2492665.1 hypothetical protein [Streptomyces sp. ISL-96]